MSSFTNVFGGSSVNPSQVAFASYSFSSSLTLVWPAFSAGNTNVAARFMNLTATANSLNVTMPDATLVSVGYDVIIFNAGSDTFNVVDSTGGAIVTITTGQTYYILLTDNSTEAGAWQTIQFGVGTGSAVAASLAGSGLAAFAGLLDVNLSAQSQSANYTISLSNLALLQVWTGGVGTITLPTAASVGDGFFFPFANNGSGSVTITASGGDHIDGAATSVFSQTQSGFIISTGSGWYTVGKGLATNFAVTLLNLNVAGSSDVTETSAQAQNVIQQYTGALTGNINVIVPATVQLYYVFNNTSGSHTLTVKTAAGTGIPVTQGNNVILYCDGTNVVNAFSSNTSFIGSPFYALGVTGGTANALTGSASNFLLVNGTMVTFTPSLPNTTVATLNVQGTGIIPIRKIDFTGIVPLIPDDLFPTIPIIAYYDLTQWVVLNLAPEGYYDAEAVDFTLSFGQTLNNIICTAALNCTLPITTSLPNYFQCSIFASGGAVTLIPDAADHIQGGGAGTHYIIPQGYGGKLVSDGISKWTFVILTTPYITNDATTNATMYPTWVTANSGNLPLKTSSTKLSFNPSTGALTSTSFVGNLTGNASGSSGSCTGNAATVTTNANLTGAVTSVGNAASLGSFTSAQLATALTDETGTGANVFANTPTLIAPLLGTPTSGVLTNCTGTASGLTAGSVTTNANLTGDVTSVGNATTIKTNLALTGVPTAPTAASGTNTTQLATTAFAHGSLTATSSGTTTLPSGLIIKWGTGPTLANNAHGTITFGTAFPNNIFSMVVTATTATSDVSDMVFTLDSIATTGCGITGNTSGTSPTANWMAIGN